MRDIFEEGLRGKSESSHSQEIFRRPLFCFLLVSLWLEYRHNWHWRVSLFFFTARGRSGLLGPWCDQQVHEGFAGCVEKSRGKVRLNFTFFFKHFFIFVTLNIAVQWGLHFGYRRLCPGQLDFNLFFVCETYLTKPSSLEHVNALS